MGVVGVLEPRIFVGLLVGFEGLVKSWEIGTGSDSVSSIVTCSFSTGQRRK
jgi:hypothetical protein